MMEFSSWLSGQVKRDDPIGDLARDAIRDGQTPIADNPKAWHRHLKINGACKEAFSALNEAWREYLALPYEPTAKKKEQCHSGVYFILDSSSNRVKIGYSQRVDRRFRQLQTAASTPLVLLGYFRGEQSLEKRLHLRFANYRKQREWFDFAREIQDCTREETFVSLRVSA